MTSLLESVWTAPQCVDCQRLIWEILLGTVRYVEGMHIRTSDS